MAEIIAEIAGFKLEAVKGTPETAPSRLFPFRGLLSPNTEDVYEPDEASGTYEELTSSTVVYRDHSLEGEGPLDTLTFPYLMAMTMNGALTPTTPAGATTARLWDAVPTATGNNQKTATIWTGDPDVALFRGDYGVCTGWTITADGSGSDGSKLSATFITREPEAITSPVVVPAKVLATEIIPLHFEVWIDNLTTGGTIGGTSVLGTVISVTHTLNLVRSFKRLPGGPDAGMSYSRVGRGSQRMDTMVRVEFDDLTIYDQWKDDDRIAVRVRHNGPIIEMDEDTPLRHFVEIDTYGKWRDMGWGEFATTNRTLDLTCRGLLNPTVGASFRARCQTTLASLN